MSSLRIGFDTGPLHGPRSGIGFAVEALHAALTASPHDIELLDYLVSFRAKPAPGVHRLALPAALAQRCWGRSDHPRADRWMRDVHLIHGTNYVVPPSRVPRLVSVYDCWFLRNPGHANRVVARAGAVLRRAIARGAVVHASSNATADAVRELLPGASVVMVPLGALPLAPPPPQAPIPELDGRPFIVAIGTLERRKNLPVLVKAFGRIAPHNPHLRLVLAGGDGDDKDKIDEAVVALGPGVANRVLFTGRVPDDVRSWLLHHAAVLAYPSLDEGFGFPLLDAMQARVPVVASNAGSIPEVASDAALMCAPGDVDMLAENLHAAIHDDAIRRGLIDAGVRRTELFTWERTANQMVDLYRRVAAGQA